MPTLFRYQDLVFLLHLRRQTRPSLPQSRNKRSTHLPEPKLIKIKTDVWCIYSQLPQGSNELLLFLNSSSNKL